jgi:hypothetical protein
MTERVQDQRWIIDLTELPGVILTAAAEDPDTLLLGQRIGLVGVSLRAAAHDIDLELRGKAKPLEFGARHVKKCPCRIALVD